MPDRAARDALIIEHAAWAAREATKVRRRKHLLIPLDETLSAAALALVEAAGRYQPGKVPFRAFAHRRIAGAVLDLAYALTGVLRSEPNGPRVFRQPTRSLDAADIAGRLRSDAPGPDEQLADDQDRTRVAGMLARLTERERETLRLYYFEDLTLAQAGARLGVTECRAWQIRRDALARLRRRP